MNYRNHILALGLILTTLFSFLPVTARAQLPELPSGRIPGVDTLIFAPLPTVPISNPAIEAKETGISIFGFTIPISWDGLAIVIAKKFIERIVESTVLWINTGFEGNPAYATNPRQYFTDIADGVAGEYIAGSDLGFLCSPFQTQVRLALLKQYTQPRPFQCTFTGIAGNLDAFYNDFNQGGWDAWFSMTQNNANNPYGAYLDAQIELDSRIAKKIGLESQQLDWNAGFLSFAECAKWEEIIIEEDVDGNLITERGKCLEREPVKTPGKVIEGRLDRVLGTDLTQLELADEFDELISALLGQVLQKSVFSAQGLFR